MSQNIKENAGLIFCHFYNITNSLLVLHIHAFNDLLYCHNATITLVINFIKSAYQFPIQSVRGFNYITLLEISH